MSRNLDHKVFFQVKSNFFEMEISQNWSSRLNEILTNTSVNYGWDNKALAKELRVSERGLFRKIKDLTGLPPRKFLRKFYLHRAMMYLQQGKYRTVRQAGLEMGYTNVSYFINQFEREFGKKPLQVLKEFGWR